MAVFWTLAVFLLSTFSIQNGASFEKPGWMKKEQLGGKLQESKRVDWHVGEHVQGRLGGEHVKARLGGEHVKARWIELTPVSSPLAATKEQMLTLGLNKCISFMSNK